MENGGKKPKSSERIDFYSDRGVQYANKKFANTIESYKVTRSMSRKGNCWDNAVAENFFKSYHQVLLKISAKLNVSATSTAQATICCDWIFAIMSGKNCANPKRGTMLLMFF